MTGSEQNESQKGTSLNVSYMCSCLLCHSKTLRQNCSDDSTFLSARQNGHSFPYKKLPLMRSPVNRANDHILKSQTVESLMSSPH